LTFPSFLPDDRRHPPLSLCQEVIYFHAFIKPTPFTLILPPSGLTHLPPPPWIPPVYVLFKLKSFFYFSYAKGPQPLLIISDPPATPMQPVRVIVTTVLLLYFLTSFWGCGVVFVWARVFLWEEAYDSLNFFSLLFIGFFPCILFFCSCRQHPFFRPSLCS